MKPSRRRRRIRQHGSSLIVTLLVTLLLGLTLASYLVLVESEQSSTARSQAWHRSMVLAEAGVEEALAQLNPGAFTAEVKGGNGWSLSDGLFLPDPPERALLGGRYAVAYTPDNPPTIYSTGYATISPGSAILSRVVCVTTTNAPLFSAGLSVERITNPSGFGYYLDSYDSENPNYSANGAYSAAKAKSPARLNPPAIARVEMPDVPPPFATGLTFPTKVGNTYTLSGNFFVDGSFDLPDSDKIYVPSNRTAVVYVTGNFSMSTLSQIEIAQTGTLKLFVGGQRASIDYINNHGTPSSFQYYGLPGNTNVTFTQMTPSLVATVYAPNASFAASNDTSLFNFAGTLTVKNLVLSRPFSFHFDESLTRNNGPRRGYVAKSWQEL